MITAISTAAPHPQGRQSQELTPQQRSEISRLKARDAEVRAHEQAHQAAGGQYVTSGASYSYETGPEGLPGSLPDFHA